MGEYIEPLITCDRILEIFTPECPAAHHDFMFVLNIKHQTPEAAYVIAALSQLQKDKHIETYGPSNNLYKVTGSTFIFKATGGYKGQIERENAIHEAKTDSERIAIKGAQSVIDTNISIQTLNNNTAIFYEKQTTFNNWQRALTIAIFISTAGYTVITYLQFKAQQSRTEQGKTQLPISIDSIKSKILSDSVFLKKLKGS